MKKIMTLAAIFAAVMMGISSCNPDDTKPEQKPDTEQPDQTPDGGEETPDGGEETPDGGEDTPDGGDEATAAITIDGDFADWDALTDVATATCDPEAGWTALKVLKAYADASAVYIYIEYVDEEIADRAWTPVHVYLDADGSAETGGYGDQYAEATCEWCLEGAIHSEDAFCSYDGGLYPWTGEVGANGWAWGDSLYSGFTSGAGKDNKYELVITKELCEDIEWAETFGLGVDIQQSWESVGVLPNAACTDDNSAGLAPLLRVTTK